MGVAMKWVYPILTLYMHPITLRTMLSGLEDIWHCWTQEVCHIIINTSFKNNTVCLLGGGGESLVQSKKDTVSQDLW